MDEPTHSPDKEKVGRRIAALRDEYSQKLPDRLRDVVDAVRRARAAPDVASAIAEAQPLLHRLRGTSASFGFEAVGSAAGRVEEAVLRLRDVEPAELAEVWSQVERGMAEVAHAVEVVHAAGVRRPPGVASSCILVVDPDESFLHQVKSLGLGLLLNVVAARTEKEALAAAHVEAPDLALIAADMPDATLIAGRLRELPGQTALPLAFLSGDEVLEHRIAAAHAGASLFLRKPIDAEAFGLAVHQLQGIRQFGKAHVLVVDDDESFGAWATGVLRAAGIAATAIQDPASVLDVLIAGRFDLVLLDVVMPRVSGLEVCRLLRTDPRWQELPIVCLTADARVESRIAAFEAGADDFLAKPALDAELLSRVRVRIDRARLHRERAEKDALTGLLLRRAFVEQMGARLAEAQRELRVLSLGLIDLDNFKAVNDGHGHLAGDRVLAALGQLLSCRFRIEDVRGRWGGEEFAVAFPGQPPRTVAAVMNRVLSEFSALEFRGDRGEPFHEQFSASVASFPDDGVTLEGLLRIADRRLYRAKTAGRGMVVAED